MAIAKRRKGGGHDHAHPNTLASMLAELKQIAEATEKADKKAKAERKVNNGTRATNSRMGKFCVPEMGLSVLPN
jgi:hypothetical protein